MTKPFVLARIVCFLTVIFAVLHFLSSACSGHQEPKSLTKSIDQKYRDWLQQHGRRYENRDEWNLRFGIYQSNVQFIDSINSLNLTYKLIDNVFADLTNHEFRSKYFGYKSRNGTRQPLYNSTLHQYNLPGSIDWRKRGAVNPVKDQGKCGSCWAYSAVAAIEGITKIKTGKLFSLSEQELVDCDVSKDNLGCDGGTIKEAYKFVINNGGITTETDYPYTGKRRKCKSNKIKSFAAKITGYKEIPEDDETALQAAVANQPVSGSVDASGYKFQFYSSGVFTGKCGSSVDHDVAIVGYGVENGAKYWLVRNSWGTSWGYRGYIKMQRESSIKGGMCGIAMEASYPVI